MAGKKNKQSIARPKGVPRAPRPKPTLRAPRTMQPSAAAAYGAIQGRKRTVPVGAITPGGCIVKNFEQLTAYTAGNNAFQNSQVFINAGVNNTFPWLSGIALNYQKFRWLFLRLFYSTSVSTASIGKAFIAVNYDPNDLAPTTLAQVEATQDSSSGPTWFGGTVNGEKAFDPNVNGDANIYVDVDVAKMSQDWYWVRANNANLLETDPVLGGVIPAGLTLSVPKNFESAAFPGVVNYGTNGMTAAVPGFLYAAYIVEFIEPVSPAEQI